MGKQKKRPHRQEEGLDKPEWAADVIKAPEKPQKPVKKETDIYLEERLGTGMLDKLAQLKAKVVEAEETAKAKIVPVTKKPSGKTARERLADDPDASFAELFDPQDSEEEAGFADLLNNSKLDWEHFK